MEDTWDCGAPRFRDGLLEWPGGGMNLAMLRALLAPAGYRLIGPAEAAVLDEMAKLQPNDIEYLLSNDFYAPEFMRDAAEAEAARRKGGG